MDTWFILKPDGVNNRAFIEEHISKQFYLSLFQEFVPTSKLITEIYCGVVDKVTLLALHEYLQEGPLIVGRMSGTINDLIKLSGQYTDPLLCAEGTLRRLYGQGKGFTQSNYPIIRNAVHRPKTASQNQQLAQIIQCNLKLD